MIPLVWGIHFSVSWPFNSSRVQGGIVFFANGHDLEKRSPQGCGPRQSVQGSNRMCTDACRTLSFVMFVALAGALPKAKLILCSRKSSSVIRVWRDVSSACNSSGSALISPKNCFRSAIDLPSLSFAVCSELPNPDSNPYFSHVNSLLTKTCGLKRCRDIFWAQFPTNSAGDDDGARYSVSSNPSSAARTFG